MSDNRLNARIRELEEDGGLMVPYFGWYWRDVDWTDDERGVFLAVSPTSPPSWWHMTAGAQSLGKTYDYGGQVRFCQNNKWGYEQFRVSGQEFVAPRKRVESFVDNPTDEELQALVGHLNRLCPEGLAEVAI